MYLRSPSGYVQLHRLNPQFLNTPLILAKKLPEKGDELAFQRSACIPQMPCPTAVSRKKKKKSPNEKSPCCSSDFRCHRPWPCQAAASQRGLTNAQRESDLTGPLSGFICRQKRPLGENLGLWPAEGQVRRGADRSSILLPPFPQHRHFSKAPRSFSWEARGCESRAQLTYLHVQRRSSRPREIK